MGLTFGLVISIFYHQNLTKKHTDWGQIKFGYGPNLAKIFSSNSDSMLCCKIFSNVINLPTLRYLCSFEAIFNQISSAARQCSFSHRSAFFCCCSCQFLF